MLKNPVLDDYRCQLLETQVMLEDMVYDDRCTVQFLVNRVMLENLMLDDHCCWLLENLVMLEDLVLDDHCFGCWITE